MRLKVIAVTGLFRTADTVQVWHRSGGGRVEVRQMFRGEPVSQEDRRGEMASAIKNKKIKCACHPGAFGWILHLFGVTCKSGKNHLFVCELHDSGTKPD